MILRPQARLSALLLAFSLGAMLYAPRHAAGGDRPNFLLIVTDDQEASSLNAYGDRACDTPNLDRLAARGACLTDAHHMGSWSGAVCLPSRTMIMTGRTVWRIPGANDELKTPAAMAEGARLSLPALFNAAGYDTYRTCKSGNTFAPANAQFKRRDEADCRGGDKPGSEWHADKTLKYLEDREAQGSDDPFFIYLGFSHPHDPRNAEENLLQKYGAENLQQPPKKLNPAAPRLPVNYLPKHPFPHGHPGLRDEEQVSGVLTDRSEATIRNETGREYACIEYLDTQVGRVLDKLEAMGELDNTYVLFTSDHGIAVGRHGLVGKQNLYEHTWTVPLLVQGPGIEPGHRASGFVYLLDLLPTMCDLAGIPVPDSVEGVSFRPVLEGKAERVRDQMYGAYCGGTKPGIRAVKTADGWKLVKHDVLDGQVRKTQLFNLNENPNELLNEHAAPAVVALTGNQPLAGQHDLADDPQHAEKRRELEALLAAEQERLGDPYPIPQGF
ncbi:Arylsulfatase [Pirellulimonas nuda]|uniref:Arylsulfatase n=1 Tax=Pirellulimonas nuda TaxID=2528009 RepID=A0A518DHP9_9BACT|nr:sulfatase-like hydrolase/transferase [Pirellulimonas nuda]QDU90994.1 Arylsulfatase [Pirellulimonas nuda]